MENPKPQTDGCAFDPRTKVPYWFKLIDNNNNNNNNLPDLHDATINGKYFRTIPTTNSQVRYVLASVQSSQHPPCYKLEIEIPDMPFIEGEGFVDIEFWLCDFHMRAKLSLENQVLSNVKAIKIVEIEKARKIEEEMIDPVQNLPTELEEIMSRYYVQVLEALVQWQNPKEKESAMTKLWV